MFKKLIAVVLFTAFAAQTFNRAVIVFNYYTNTAAFARNCENKAKPKLHCNGRCQMMKKLKQEENKDKQNPERRQDNKDEVLFFSKSQITLQYYNPCVVIPYPVFIISPTTHISLAFFKPPQLA